MIDTLMIARRKHPGGSNRLDDLCARYAIDNSRRTKHGALLDAELLAEVYVELIDARQAQLVLAQTTMPDRVAGEPIIVCERGSCRWWFGSPKRSAPRTGRSLPRSAKRRSGATISARIDRLRRRRGLCGRQALAIERDKIDRFKQQRRETAVSHRRGDDLARERK